MKQEHNSEPTFEEALEQLEAIVAELERGAPELSQALARYEQGVKLVARCNTLLDGAERSVALLTGVDDSGNPITTVFDATATVDRGGAEKKSPKASPRKPAAKPAPPPIDDTDDDSIPF
jgi:exodeoxyribonuclease VII small subunit